MAPQTSIPLAANVLGTIGTIFWCVQLIPQIWYNWRYKKTDGLPALMMFLWAICSVPLGVYSIVQNFNLPVQIQPQIFCALALVSWAQILMYSHDWPTWKATSYAVALGVVFGGVETLLILTLRGPYARGTSWPVLLVGVLAVILLAAGLLPPYPELWKRSGRVVGINFVFLTMDWLGAFFSLLALAFQNTFDILGGISYLICIILEIGIFTSHFVWLMRTRKLRKQAKLQGVDFDDLPEARKYQIQSPGVRRESLSMAASRELESGNRETRKVGTKNWRFWSRGGESRPIVAQNDQSEKQEPQGDQFKISEKRHDTPNSDLSQIGATADLGDGIEAKPAT